jgi:hypothetical protein
MITADEFDSFANQLLPLFDEYEIAVLEDIARRIKNINYASAAWQVQRLTESGMLYRDVVKRLAKLTGMSERKIAKIMKEAGVTAIKFDDAIYREAGLSPIPLNMSPAMLRALETGIRKTQGIISNFSRSTALTSQQLYIRATDIAYLQVSTGTMSYDQAIKYAIKKAAEEGVTILYPSGHVDKLDVAIRRAVLTGIGQTTGLLQTTRMDEMGVDLVEVSAHIGARNEGDGYENHESWQGKIYSRSGANRKYPPFVESTGYGTGAGLAGWNCRHSFYPFFEGISERAYSNKTLKEYERETVKYNGKDISNYEASQIQRAIERKIRRWKREAAAVEAGGYDNSFELGKVKYWQQRMRKFIAETKLDRQRVREQVYHP